MASIFATSRFFLDDGSCYRGPIQIVETDLSDYLDSNRFDLWNVLYFPSMEKAQQAFDEYVKLIVIKDFLKQRVECKKIIERRREKYKGY